MRAALDRVLLGAICLLLLAPLAAAGGDIDTEPLRLLVPDVELYNPTEEWYGIYTEDSKLGYLRNTIRHEPSIDRFVVENEMHLKVVTMGERREVRSLEIYNFLTTPPFRLDSGTSVIDQGPFRQEIELVTLEEAYEATIRAADSTRLLPVEDPDYTLSDILTPELWFRQVRDPGEQLVVRSFSIAELTPSLDTYSVRGVKHTVVDGVPVEYYEVALHSSAVGSVGTALIDQQGFMVSGVIGGAFELRSEPAELARDFDYTADVYLLGLAEVDQPLGDPRSIRRLVLEVEGRDPGQIPSSARQQLIFDDEKNVWVLRLGAGEGVAEPVTEEQIEAALEESVEYPIREAAIVDLAREAVGEAQGRREQVEALVSFVDRFLADSYSAEPLTVLDMLTTRKGDCTEHALLFTTLARSLGIPTREVTGLLYLGDDVRAFGGHAWNEVALEGYWHPVDATWGEFEINAAHIHLGPRTGEGASAEALFGGYRFELVDVERR